MGLISSSGIGSNVNVDAIVKAIVNAQKIPATQRLDSREASIQADISGFGSLSSALADFKTALAGISSLSDFSKRTASSSDPTFLTVSAGSNATPANFAVDVVSIAQGSRLQSGTFTGTTSTVGSGTLTFTAGTSTFNVTVAATDTLANIRDNINAAAANFGVNANLVTGNAGTVLVLDSSTTGTANQLVVSNNNASLDSISTLLTTAQSATDAQITVAGQTITNSTNTFTTAITDVTLTAVKVTTASINASVSLDTGSVTTAVNSFVNAYNALTTTTSKLGSANLASPGVLMADSTLRILQNQLRSKIGSPVASVSGQINSLAALGISTTRTGTLQLDSTKLSQAISNNFADLGNLFASPTDGIAVQLSSLVDQYIGPGGVLTSRTDTLNSQLGRIATERSNLTRRLGQLETRLRAQFGAMDVLVAQLNSTGQFLTQQFANMSGFSGK